MKLFECQLTVSFDPHTVKLRYIGECFSSFFYVFCLVGVLLPEDIGEPTMCNVEL